MAVMQSNTQSSDYMRPATFYNDYFGSYVSHGSPTPTKRKRLTVIDSGATNGDRHTPNWHAYSVLETYQGGLSDVKHGYAATKNASSRRQDVCPIGAPPISQVFTDGFASFNYNPDWAMIEEKAMEKIYDQIRGNSNLAVDFAERAATLKMLRSSLSLKGMMKEFSKKMLRDPKLRRMKGKPGMAGARTDYVSGKWLEYRYGWLPLIHSIWDAAETLRRDTTAKLITVKARSSFSCFGKVVTGTGTYADPKGVTTISQNFRVEYALRFELPQGYKLADWTSLNPLGIAWELVPFSFVADWMVNVSQQLSLWENYFVYSTHFRGGYKTQTALEQRYGSFQGTTRRPISYTTSVPAHPFDVTYQESIASTASGLYKYKRRVRVLSLPTPSGFRVKVNMNANRIADTAALLTGFVRRIFK